MFQLGSLVVLCGLLTGTSASVSEIIQELDVPETIQIFGIWIQDIENNNLVPVFFLDYNRFNFSLLMKNMRIPLDELIILELQDRLSSNNKSKEMKMPLVVDFIVIKLNNYPRNNITALKLQCSLRIERDKQNRQPYLTMWKCSNETMKEIFDSSGRLVTIGSI